MWIYIERNADRFLRGLARIAILYPFGLSVRSFSAHAALSFIGEIVLLRRVLLFASQVSVARMGGHAVAVFGRHVLVLLMLCFLSLLFSTTLDGNANIVVSLI